MPSLIIPSQKIYTLTCHLMSEASLFVCDPLKIRDEPRINLLILSQLISRGHGIIINDNMLFTERPYSIWTLEGSVRALDTILAHSSSVSSAKLYPYHPEQPASH